VPNIFSQGYTYTETIYNLLAYLRYIRTISKQISRKPFFEIEYFLIIIFKYDMHSKLFILLKYFKKEMLSLSLPTSYYNHIYK